jgi:tRNA/tmRNA/rRNA uracil-C5-methylase (TrmA/RlmC/RlmD family)
VDKRENQFNKNNKPTKNGNNEFFDGKSEKRNKFKKFDKKKNIKGNDFKAKSIEKEHVAKNIELESEKTVHKPKATIEKRHEKPRFVKPIVKNKEIKKSEPVAELKYFSDYVKRQIPKHISENKNFLNIEPLALLEYDHEIKIKELALSDFLKKHSINCKTEKITKSPKSRNYRTTTKRKLNIDKGKFTLVFTDENVVNFNNLISVSALEPVEHKDIYFFIAEKINQPAYHIVGKSLNYVIIRGTYNDFSVVFNIHIMNADNVRKIKLLAEELKKLKTNIRGVYIYLDPTKSDYYFESKRPDVPVNFKNVFGPDKILVNFNGNKYSFLPTSFSQVNESIVPVFLEKVKSLLRPQKDQVLIDLYSGYGLFSQYLADSYADVFGMEADLEAVKSAKENISFTNKKNVRFLAMRVTNNNIDKYIPKSFRYDEVFILDPPKMGAEDKVIQTVANRTPNKVVHIFCGTDNIPDELKKWEQFGYRPVVISPVDMFPGSANLEVLVLLTKKN